MENYNIIETVAASAANVALTGNGQLAITGAPVVPLKTSRLGARIPAAAAVARVATVTITTTPAANTRYAFIINQKIGDNVVTRTISVRTGAVAPTASSISNQFKTQVEASLKVTASVGGSSDSVTTITAAAGFEIFAIATVANATVAITTPGNYAVGLGSVLNQTMSGFVGANFYDAYPIEIGTPNTLNGGLENAVLNTPYTVYVNIGTNAGSPSANSALVAIAYSNVARGYVPNAGVAVSTQAALQTAITGAADWAAGKVVLAAAVPKIGVDVYNQITSG